MPSPSALSSAIPSVVAVALHRQTPRMCMCLQYKAKRNALYDPDGSDEEDSIKASRGKKQSKHKGGHKSEKAADKADPGR